MSYDRHQRDAIRLTCAVCLKPYDVTHADTGRVFICAWCLDGREGDEHPQEHRDHPGD